MEKEEFLLKTDNVNSKALALNFIENNILLSNLNPSEDNNTSTNTMNSVFGKHWQKIK